MITQQDIKKDLEQVSNTILDMGDSKLMEIFTCNEYQQMFTSKSYISINPEKLSEILGEIYCKKVLKIPYRLCFIHSAIGKIGGMNMSYDDLLNLCEERRRFAQWVADNSENLAKAMINNKNLRQWQKYDVL